MIEQVLNRINLNRAYVQVCRNKGAGGVDGVQTEDLGEHFKTHGKQYLENIQNGCYEVGSSSLLVKLWLLLDLD